MPTEAEEALFARARSTFQIKEEGGLPSRETGLFESEDPAIRQRLIEQKAQEILSIGAINGRTGQPYTQEEAIIRATEFIDRDLK